MMNITNLAAAALHAHATLLIELNGTVAHKQLRKEADRLEKLGVDHQDVYNALFSVENLVIATGGTDERPPYSKTHPPT